MKGESSTKLSLDLKVGETLFDLKIKLALSNTLEQILFALLGLGQLIAYPPTSTVKNRYVLRIQNLNSLCLRIGITSEKLIKIIAELDSKPSALYGVLEQEKETGEIRIINPPCWRLKTIQSKILARLLNNIPISEYTFGWVKGRDRLKCVEGHVGKKILLQADIANFFPSIRFGHVYRVFERLECHPIVSKALTRIMTYNKGLPQGAPTSPQLANIILKQLDDEFSGFWRKRGVHYSRFGDDIIVSSNRQIAKEFFKDIITKGLEKFDLKPKLRKFSSNQSWTRQEALGVIVNRKTNAPKEEIHELEVILHNAESTGLEMQNRQKEPNFPAHIAGKIAQVKALNPSAGEKLWSNFKKVNF